MPLELSDLARKTKTVEVTLEETGDKFSVTYYPHKFTPEVNLALSFMFEDGVSVREAFGNFATTLASLINKWDITNDGQPWPVTPDNINALSDNVIRQMLDTIREDRRPNAKSANS